MSITHTITQTSASTVAEIAYIHGHDEDDDIFVAQYQKLVKGKKHSVVYQGTKKDLINPRYGGTVTDVTPSNITGDPKNNAESLNAKSLPWYGSEDSSDYQSRAMNNVVSEAHAYMATHPAAEGETGPGGSQETPSTIDDRPLTIVEVLQDGSTYKGTGIEVPFENQVRPPWLSKVFQNQLIAEEVYRPIYGVDSITLSNDQVSKLKWESQMKENMAPVNSDTFANDELEVLITDNSIKAAANYIASQYSAVREANTDDATSTWVDNYTQRPVATMRQVLGDPEVLFDKTTGEVTDKTKMGFHTKAFGYKEVITSIKSAGEQGVTMTSDLSGIASLPIKMDEIDPRPDRRQAVTEYLLSLSEESLLIG